LFCFSKHTHTQKDNMNFDEQKYFMQITAGERTKFESYAQDLRFTNTLQ